MIADHQMLIVLLKTTMECTGSVSRATGDLKWKMATNLKNQ